MSAQLARDGTHSKKGVHFSAASATCSVFDKAAISGERAYPCTAADMAEVLSDYLANRIIDPKYEGPLAKKIARKSRNSRRVSGGGVGA